MKKISWLKFGLGMALLIGMMGACDSRPPSNVFSGTLEGDCKTLFGRPSDNTGLDKTQCGSACSCNGVSWEPPAYDEAAIAELKKWKLSNPPALLKEDPYKEAQPPADKKSVCAMIPDESKSYSYSLKTFTSVELAEDAGGWVTHFGGCGQCSSIENLLVYITKTDLTDPVRSCALKGLGGNDDEAMKCLMEVGFDKPCAQIWFYNTVNTRKACLAKCMQHMNSKHHTGDGKLNPCIQCDEDKSGPVFKSIAGRTRRNSGLASALCRPCDSVSPIAQRFPSPKQ